MSQYYVFLQTSKIWLLWSFSYMPLEMTAHKESQESILIENLIKILRNRSYSLASGDVQ